MTDISALGLKVTGTGIVKTTNELDAFAKAAKAAGAAAKSGISFKVSSSAAKAAADIRAIERALVSIRAASKSAIGIRVTTAGNAKAVSDVAKMGTALREARAAAKAPIVVRVSAMGVSEAVAGLNRFTAAATAARAAAGGGIAARTSSTGGGGTGGGGPSASDASAVSSMAGAMRGLVAISSAYVALGMAKKFLEFADASKMLEAQLRLATAQTGSFAQAQEDVRRIAATTRSDLESTAKLYGNFQRNARELGITQVEAARATETVAKAFKISGAATVEAAQGTRQLVQALQSGVLRGDEFNTIMEAAPRLSRLLADSLGVPVGALRKMAEEGKLTSATLTRALTDKKFTEGLDREFRQLPVTFEQAVSQLQQNAGILVGTFDKASGTSGALAKSIMDIADSLKAMEGDVRRWGEALRVEAAGASAAFGPLLEKVSDLWDLFQREFSLNINLDEDYKTIDAFTGWLSKQGILGRTLTGNDWDAENPTGTTMYRDSQAAKQREREAIQTRQDGGFAGRWLDKASQDGGAYAQQQTAATTATVKRDKASENLAARLERERKAEEATIAGLYKAADAYNEGTAAGDKMRIMAEAQAKAIKGQGDEMARASREWRKHVAERTADAARQAASVREETASMAYLAKQVADGTITTQEAAKALDVANQTRELSVLAQNAEGEAAVRLKKAITDLTNALHAQIEARELASAQSQTEQLNKQIKLMGQELALTDELGKKRLAALKGPRGEDQEEALAAINVEGQKRIVMMRAEADAAEKRDQAAKAASQGLRDELNKQADAIINVAKAEANMIDLSAKFDKEERSAARLVARVDALAGALSGIPGIGGLIGAFSSGNPIQSLLGMGGAGTIAGTLLAPDTFKTLGRDIAFSIDKILRPGLEGSFDRAFGKTGQLSQTLSGILQGAGIGSITAGLVGNGSTGSQIGGQVGGAIGQAAATKLLSSLGSAAGPIGAVAGAVLGSALGGLFKKTPTGSAILGQGGIIGTSGNGGRDATGIGNSVLEALNKIGSALGVSASGNYAVSIGMRGDAYRVDTTGAGRTKESDVLNFGADAEAAVKAAVRDAIGDGVFEGLSEGTKKFLLNGDLETQLSKFANYKSVLDAADQAANPQSFELQGLATAEAQFKSVAIEIGASAEEIARVEAYYAQQRLDVIEKYAADAVQVESDRQQLMIQIMELEGNSIGALAEARRIEKAAADASLGPLYDRLYALQDEAKAASDAADAAEKLAAKTKAIYDERRTLEERLLTLLGNTNELRRRELETIDPSNRNILETIWEIEDLNKKRAEEAAALEELKRKEQERIQGMAAYNQKIGALFDARVTMANRNVVDQAKTMVAANDNISNSLETTIEKFQRFTDALMDFRDELTLNDIPGPGNFAAIQNRFNTTARDAAAGNAGALEGLPGISRQFLDASMARASTMLDYQRQALVVRDAVDAGLQASSGVVTDAQALLNYMQGLTSNTKEIRDAINDLKKSGELSADDQKAILETIAVSLVKTAKLDAQLSDGGSALRVTIVSQTQEAA